VGRLLILDALEMSWREVALRRNPGCPVCGDDPTQTELIDYEIFCGFEAPASGGGPPAPSKRASDEEPVQSIGPEALSRLLAERDDLSGAPTGPFLLDVREPWEWSVSNLAEQGARLVPLGELEERVAEIPRDRPVVVYCKSGGRSERAARALRQHGFRDVTNLEGGIVAWARALAPDMRIP